ncbi:hypothetical protein SFRURICE_013990 [Spodoptera frugiperda]|nr:hypothetical protein SFRURICE_013990 [Spodoptera frugiperda]
MADLSVDISKLPDEIRDKLAELDLELSEDITPTLRYDSMRQPLITSTSHGIALTLLPNNVLAEVLFSSKR